MVVEESRRGDRLQLSVISFFAILTFASVLDRVEIMDLNVLRLVVELDSGKVSEGFGDSRREKERLHLAGKDFQDLVDLLLETHI